MNYWIFQGNPDVFPMRDYIADYDDLIWSVRQKHLADLMNPGDLVFLWIAKGSSKGDSGIIAQGTLTSSPEMIPDDDISKELWEAGKNIELRVRLKVDYRCLGAKEMIKRNWLTVDPIVSDMLILKQPAGTNFPVTFEQAERLSDLVANTGRDWSIEESIAGLWAYSQTYGGPVSKTQGSPVAQVAINIGRSVTGIYNKVMNFRALDIRDERKGLIAGSLADSRAWEQFYDADSKTIDNEKLNQIYQNLWETKAPVKTYIGFGDAPNDDPSELQVFASRVRKGQPSFRKNLMQAYDNKCSVTGHGPAEVLEAVHIVPHSVSGINALDNGLLLRADLHSLFDANLLTIDPATCKVSIDESLNETLYREHHGAIIRLRKDGTQISQDYLKLRKEITDSLIKG